jgi:membrane-bound acyltransferase YfiQ involved in biofilm formation
VRGEPVSSDRGPEVQVSATPELGPADVTPKPRRRFFPHIHRLRGIAIIGVVSIHVISVLGLPLPVWAEVPYDVVFGEGSPIFLMISGFLFREGLAKYAYPRFIDRKVRNVLIPYLVVSIPALVIYLGGFKTSHPWLSEDFFDRNPVVQTVVLLVTGAHLGPLWFIPMILLFFIVSPVFVYIDRHPRTYLVLPLLFVVTVLVPRPYENSNPIQSFVHFLSLFVLGMWLARHHDRLIDWYQQRRATVLGLGLVLVVVLAVIALDVPSVDSLMRGAFGTLLVFVLYTWRDLGRPGIWLDKLGEASFPVFFLHGYPVAVLRALVPEDVAIGPWTWLALWLPLTFGIAAGTAAFAFAVRRVLGKRSRYLVGL